MSLLELLRTPITAPAPTYTPPTIVDDYPGTYSLTGTSQTRTIDVQAGDLIIVLGNTPDDTLTLVLPTASGNTFVNQNTVQVASYTEAGIWTATAAATNAALVVTQTVTGGTGGPWSFDVIVCRDWGGLGITQKTNVASGAPSRMMRTRRANSALFVVNGDWAGNDGASRAWRSVNGAAPVEVHYFRDAANYTTYAAYWANAGQFGDKNVGLSSPGQKYSIVALEVFGLVATGGTTPVAKTSATSWAVRSTVTKTSITTWAVRTPVAKTSVTSWAVRSAVVKSSATSWSVRSRVTQTRQTLWAVRAVIVRTVASPWSVRTAIAKTHATSWAVRTSVAKSTATTWAVRGRVVKTSASSWAVRAAVARTSATSWAVRARITTTRATSWDVASSVLQVVKTVTTSWAVRSRTTATRTTVWGVRAQVTRASATAWGVRTGLTKTSATGWGVRSLVVVSRGVSWAVRQTVQQTRASSWSVWTPVARLVATFWDVLSFILPADISIGSAPLEQRWRIAPLGDRISTAPVADRWGVAETSERLLTVPLSDRWSTTPEEY